MPRPLIGLRLWMAERRTRLDPATRGERTRGFEKREIRIENARSHNLRGIDCGIPLGALTVVTGPSGSGKSTLAFDTLYAEGQRRYVSSLSAYARQFLERLPRPEVDHISNLPPAIAIEQRNGATSSRSTVGSATEVLDQLRLLFASLGETICPDCGGAVDAGGIIATADRIAVDHAGERIFVVAPLRRGLGRAAEVRDELVRDGHARLLDADGELVDLLEKTPRAKPSAKKPWWLLIDRLALESPDGDDAGGDAGQRSRLIEAVSQAFARGDGELMIRRVGAPRAADECYREGRVCEGCGRRFPEPSPQLFSFNSPVGACPTCEGFGRIAEIDWDRVVPDTGLSLAEDAIATFATKNTTRVRGRMLEACAARGIDLECPFADLEPAQRHFVFEGDGDSWGGVRAFFDWLAGRRYKIQARVQLARHRRYEACPDCAGTRLSSDARAVFVEGVTIADLAGETLAELLAWTLDLEARGVGGEAAARLLELIRTRLRTIHAVGLGYLTLDRTLRSLSGGEAQRIQLATALGGNLSSSLYVLDEPSIGLHAADLGRLLRVLIAIRDQGNTVVVVEHALQVIEAADHIIDLGPGAGRQGGHVVAAGGIEAIRATGDSKTGAALRRELGFERRSARDLRGGPRLRIVGASAHNLKHLTVEIPLRGLVAVTGLSGAGKSTLLRDVLVPALRPARSLDPAPQPWSRIEGADALDEVVVVDQAPANRSARSNPATITKAFDGIRKRFAATREAKARGWSPGYFSFNVAGGRCDACEGAGEVLIDMQFLDDLRVACDACGGRRYRREVIDIEIDGRSIVDVLKLSLEEACSVFEKDTKITGRLEPLVRVGLGYLSLGQPLSTLSGGEYQRLRLGQALVEGAERTLYIFDEPTTGLHPCDTDVLLRCFDEVIEAGASVLVVEHDLDVIRSSDWVIDLGPGGGPDGGRIVATGPPREIALAPGSLTGRSLAAAS
ncbi:MAG: excinuclease ABC subunit UvrA [Deltaproteobacteria bacterium]|nr:excinuclease ABC subunit UvrA [Deltaproteobacteria bacterium]